MPVVVTPTVQVPALMPSSMSALVSPTLTTADGGKTRSASMARSSIQGSGRPAGTSSAQTITSGS